MPDTPNKKYYWLRLHRDFFKRHDIQVIESMDNGKDYVLFYLKLLVESIDHEGRLRFSETIPYNEQMLATITHTNVDVVRSALKIFEELEMISVLDDQTLYMEKVSEMIGTSSTDDPVARENHRLRQQRYRERQKLLTSRDGNVTVTRDVEIEKEIEKDTDIDNMSGKITEIVSFLNETCETNYKASSEKTRKLIKARFNEGFTVEDFKTVITKKANKWKSDEKMSQYLRPETLFGTKFEGYLNEQTRGGSDERDNSSTLYACRYNLYE